MHLEYGVCSLSSLNLEDILCSKLSTPDKKETVYQIVFDTMHANSAIQSHTATLSVADKLSAVASSH
jgi:hypothetical protein